MIKKIETLLCIQEFVKDRKLMESYFNESDIKSLKKFCTNKFLEVDLEDEIERENVSRLIQLLLGSDLHLHAENYKENVNRCSRNLPTNFLLN